MSIYSDFWNVNIESSLPQKCNSSSCEDAIGTTKAKKIIVGISDVYMITENQDLKKLYGTNWVDSEVAIKAMDVAVGGVDHPD